MAYRFEVARKMARALGMKHARLGMTLDQGESELRSKCIMPAVGGLPRRVPHELRAEYELAYEEACLQWQLNGENGYEG